jgi:hypothetical protein
MRDLPGQSLESFGGALLEETTLPEYDRWWLRKEIVIVTYTSPEATADGSGTEALQSMGSGEPQVTIPEIVFEGPRA